MLKYPVTGEWLNKLRYILSILLLEHDKSQHTKKKKIYKMKKSNTEQYHLMF